jgi:hypothetical protein
MKNETTLSNTQAVAMACVNALKAMSEGRLDVAETFAPGFVDMFLSLGEDARRATVDQLLTELAA